MRGGESLDVGKSNGRKDEYRQSDYAGVAAHTTLLR